MSNTIGHNGHSEHTLNSTNGNITSSASFYDFLLANCAAQAVDFIRQAKQHNQSQTSDLFRHIARCNQREFDYKTLCQLASRYYQLPLCDANAVCLNAFNEPFWQSYRKRHGAVPLWQMGQILFIGIYWPTQALDEQTIRFTYQFRCQKVLLYAPKYYQQSDNAGQQEAQHDVIAQVAQLLHHARTNGASDIHLEPFEHSARIRMRCDGVLIQHQHLAKSQINAIISRLKILANMDIAEKRLPQDGRMLQAATTPTTTTQTPNDNLRHDSEYVTHIAANNVMENVTENDTDHAMDWRLSTMPTLFGEKMVIRLLGQSHQALLLDRLGMNAMQQQLVQRAMQQKQGMLIVTGPTGSGKTNTLYAMIKQLNVPQVNICSVEDPVEIYLDGINQINTNNKAGLTFAKILRGLLRQDPDILMVGEIRDSETADIALKAAQTGHMLLSSLHTNDALSSITRLLDMGIAMYQIRAALHTLIAQRLVRTLCKKCKTPIAPETDLPPELCLENKTQHIYQAVGCSYCHQGYRRRTGIFEVVHLSDALKSAIENGTTSKINQALAAQSFQSLTQSAREKITQGITSIDEVMRVL